MAAPGAASQAIWGLDDGGSADDRIVVWRNSTPKGRVGIVDGGVASVDDTHTADLPNATAGKAAIAWNTNDFAWSQNGATVRTDGSVAVPTSLDNLTLGKDHTSAQWGGYIRRFSYWNSRVANADLVSLAA